MFTGYLQYVTLYILGALYDVDKLRHRTSNELFTEFVSTLYDVIDYFYHNKQPWWGRAQLMDCMQHFKESKVLYSHAVHSSYSMKYTLEICVWHSLNNCIKEKKNLAEGLPGGRRREKKVLIIGVLIIIMLIKLIWNRDIAC